MPKVTVLSQTGKKAGSIELNDAVFGIEPNQQVIYDVVNAQRAALRQGTHSTKTRSEVRGGGRKPWRQKGTGRARQGSIRAPQWRGGGITFGPTPRDYSVKVNRKVAKLALRSAYSYKVKEELITVIDKFELTEIKTKDFANILKNVNVEGKTLVVLTDSNENVERSAKNIGNVFVTTASHASVLDILSYKNLIIEQGAIEVVEKIAAPTTEEVAVVVEKKKSFVEKVAEKVTGAAKKVEHAVENAVETAKDAVEHAVENVVETVSKKKHTEDKTEEVETNE